jgi:uncharacterized protein (DUF2147 family)
MRRVAIFVLLFFSSLAGMAAAAVPAAGVFGDWKTPTGSVVHVVACGQDVCLGIAKLAAGAPETTDKQNPNAGLRGRALCGLTIGTGFHQDDPGHLSGGKLYDPKSGHTYSGTIVVSGDTLKLHGYVGIAMFGRSETWTRTGEVGSCEGRE